MKKHAWLSCNNLMQPAFRILISDIFAWLFQYKIQYLLPLRRIGLKN